MHTKIPLGFWWPHKLDSARLTVYDRPWSVL